MCFLQRTRVLPNKCYTLGEAVRPHSSSVFFSAMDMVYNLMQCVACQAGSMLVSAKGSDRPYAGRPAMFRGGHLNVPSVSHEFTGLGQGPLQLCRNPRVEDRLTPAGGNGEVCVCVRVFVYLPREHKHCCVEQPQALPGVLG